MIVDRPSGPARLALLIAASAVAAIGVAGFELVEQAALLFGR